MMLLVMLITCATSPVQVWNVKASGNNMYGIWCSTCGDYVDHFHAVPTGFSNHKRASNDWKDQISLNGSIYIYCKNCNKTLLIIRDESEESHYSESDLTTYYHLYLIEKFDNTVTFPNMSAEEYSESDEDTSSTYQVDVYNNIIGTDDYYDTYDDFITAANWHKNLTTAMFDLFETECTRNTEYYQTYTAKESDFTWTDWYDAGSTSTANGTVYTGLTTYLSKFGITAQRVDSYTITFSGNGGNGSMEAQVSNGGSAVTLNSNTFSRQGYTFSGWATTANGSVAYNNGATVTPTADMTLYAVWTVNNYNVTCIDMDSSHNVELGKSTVQKAYGATVKGSDFGADKTTGAYYSGYQFTVGTSTTVIDGENVIYRYFAPQNYAVTLVDMVLNEDTVLGTDTTLNKLAGDTVKGSDYGTTSPYTGYTFNSDTSTTVSAAGTTVYRYFTRNNYTVSYIDVVSGDGGKELGRNNIDKGFNVSVSGAEMGTDTTAGAYYPGYYYTGNSSTSTVTVDGATVYRYFSPASYDITYISVLNDIAGKELGREMAAGAGVFGTVVSGDALGTDTTDGAYFTGYTYFASTQATVTTDGAVVYRLFSSSSYDLNLELNGGTLDDPVTSYQYGTATNLPNAYRIGYSFAGWYDNEQLTGEPITEIDEDSIGPKTFFAAWDHDTYSVSMDFAGTGNSVSVYRDGSLVEDGSLYYGDTIRINFGADAGRRQNGYDITETVTDAQATDTGITFTMPDSDVYITTYWLECTELEAVTNSQFDTSYRTEPYWNGTSFNIDATPAITIASDMVDVFAKIYDTKTQQWNREAVDPAKVSFIGSNILSDINETNFTISADVFDDGYNQQGTFSLLAESGALNDAMHDTNSATYEELKTYIDNMENDILLYEQLVVDLQTKLQISNALKEEYASKIASLSESLAEAQEAYRAAQEANAERIKELQELLSQKESDYNKQVEELTKQIAKIEEDLLAEGADVESLTNQKNELSKQLADLISSHEKETAELQSELDSLNAEIQQYKDKVDSLVSELESTKETYENEIANLEQELAEIQSKVADLLAKIAAMEATIKELLGREDIDISNGSLEDLKNLLDELKKQMEELNGKNNTLEEDINKKQEEINALDKIIEDLKEQNKNHSGSSSPSSDSGISDKEYSDVKNQNTQLSEQLQNSNAMLQDREKVIAALESQKESLNNEIIILKEQLSDSQNQILSLQMQLKEKDALLAEKAQEIESLQAYITELKQQGIIYMSTQTEKEVSLADADTQVKPLTLITVSGEIIKADDNQELLSDIPVITEKVSATATLTEGDNMNRINPWLIGIIVFCAIGSIGGGAYFLNRKYHFFTL